MIPSTHLLAMGRTLLLAAILALAIATGAQPAGAVRATCSDMGERYPMLIGSGYEGVPCATVEIACSDTADRYPMLIGSGYEGQSCDSTLASTPRNTARSATTSAPLATDPNWHDTMLDGSGYEGQNVDTAFAGQR